MTYEVRAVLAEECPGDERCTGTHFQFTEEEARLVAKCRAQAEAKRAAAKRRREAFRGRSARG